MRSTPVLSFPSDFSALRPFGWTDRELPRDTRPGRLSRHDGSTLSVITADGATTVHNVLGLDPEPTVGDWLALDDTGRIVEVLERSTVLRRQAADARGSQTLAANVDIVLITCGADRPLKSGRIHRSVAISWEAGATPMLVLTKSATDRADAAALDLPRLELEHPGVRVFVTSALENVGVEAVRDAIAGKTSVLLGESGAGKSTLVNALLGSPDAITGDVREGDSKGRHTTTARQLHVLPGEAGGVIVDTPGIRSVGLLGDADAVIASFAEIAELESGCRFADCNHSTEPGCAVLEALANGELNAERYEAWRKMQREATRAAIRAAPRDHGKEIRELKRRGRASRDSMAIKRGEYKWR